jgi:hypothetical protein
MTQTDRASRALHTLLQRRDQVEARRGGQHIEDDALARLASSAAAIDEVWAEGVRRIEDLEQQAQRVRDEVRRRTAVLEAEQAGAVLDLARIWPAEDLALLMGVPPAHIEEMVRDAQEHMVPWPRA